MAHLSVVIARVKAVDSRRKEFKEHAKYRDSLVKRLAYKATSNKDKFAARAQKETGYLDAPLDNVSRKHQADLPVLRPFLISNRLVFEIMHHVFIPLVVSYAPRTTTFPDDIINAFGGVIGALTPILGSFRCGIPRNFSLHGMCWSYHGPFRRRPSFPS
ncbi:hypothetical protein B0T26DRAFT_768680 [Lasiosphaeria miniovina]|uniref:Uncharacterized protein n=1 Tax=Lasiosphaeria miniovina TaxID=1954250 RepID=A0AA40B6W7_9PEZI|nr:uncharacterized protein B0T26DRAFT_768680 [Lasiosphaeria miniovina]KAK0728790.1 hypothetical protein B0T26DRAFT_768680 [Lasiosphaeria miniovina]